MKFQSERSKEDRWQALLSIEDRKNNTGLREGLTQLRPTIAWFFYSQPRAICQDLFVPSQFKRASIPPLRRNFFPNPILGPCTPLLPLP